MKKIYLSSLLILAGLFATAQCSTTIMTNNGTSGLGRAPAGNYMSIRTVYLITPAEMAAAGFLTGQSLTEIGWSNNTAAIASITGNLNIYLQNTNDVAYNKGAVWGTAIGGMSSHLNAPTALPTAVGPYSIPLASGFSYTGGGVYVAFEWTNCGAVTTSYNIDCNTDLVGGLMNVRSTTSCTHGTALAASSFRPSTSFSSTVANDAKVSYIYNFGELVVGKSTNIGLGATIANNSGAALPNVVVTLNITGANTFSTTATIASLLACSSTFVAFTSLYTPTNEGIDTVRVTIPADANNANNTLQVLSRVNKKDIAYKNFGETSNGGAGFNAGTGTIAMRFTTAVPAIITHANLSFNTVTTPSQYRIAIYPDNSGVPSTIPIYMDGGIRTNSTGQLTIKLDSAVSVPAGTFYLALQQVSLDNFASGFSPETPVRSGSFFFSSLTPVTWTDFASAGFNAKLISGVKFCFPSAPLAIIGNNTGCEGSSVLFVADTTGILGVDSFTWILPPGYIGNSTKDSIYVTAAATPGPIRCVANYPCGTSDTVSLSFTPTVLSNTIAQSNNGNTASTAGSAAKSNFQADGQIVYYSDASCQPIALVVDTMGGNMLGATTATVNVAATVPTYNSQPYCQRTFTITPSNNGDAIVQLYVSQADFTAYNAAATGWPQMPTTGNNADPNIANVRITKVDGALGVGPSTVITPTLNWNSTGSFWEVYFPVSNFSTFYIHGANPANQALPVVWQSFDVKKEGSTALLNWSTSAEHNNSHFNIQHSSNGRDFENIGTLKTLAFNGNTNDLSNYKFEHATPTIGTNYYRIEQVDQDKNSSFSRVKELMWAYKGNTYVVYPQPAADEINIEGSITKDAQLRLELTDLSGKIISSQSISVTKGMAEFGLNSSHIQNGFYLLRILENDKISFTQKVSVYHK